MPVNSAVGSSAVNSDQNANAVFAGPTTGAASTAAFRAMVAADLPQIPNSNLVNQGDNALLAFQEMGANFKAATIGNAWPGQGATPTLTNGRIYWHCVYVPKAFTATGVSFWLAQSGVYTASGYNGFGLYSINVGTGVLTQIAATTSSTTLFAGATGLTSVNFASTVALTEGIYYIGWLYGNSAQTTAPLLIMGSYGQFSFTFANSIRPFARLNSQTALPASQAFSGLSGETVILYTWLF